MPNTYHVYLQEAVEIQTDQFGRHFMEYTHMNPNVGRKRYFVPFSAHDEGMHREWIVHERHRLAVPASISNREGIVRKFTGPDSSWIFLIEAERLACAELIALACGVRIGGWGTGSSHDCSGRSFASAADSFLARKWDDRKPGARSRHRTYGFLMSSEIDC